MYRVASSFCRIDLPLVQALPLLHDDMTTTIEIFCEAPHLDVHGDWRTTVQWLRQYADVHDVAYAVHAPCFDVNPAAANRGVRAEVCRQYMLALNVAHELGASQMVIHSGHRSDPRLSIEDAQGWTRALLEALVPQAERQGVRLALENTGYGVASIIRTLADLLTLVDGLPAAVVGLTLDIGHAALQHLDLTATIEAWRPRLLNVHLHDNHGQDDDHLPPSRGSLPLAAGIASLHHHDYAGPLVMESFLGGTAPITLTEAWSAVL